MIAQLNCCDGRVDKGQYLKIFKLVGRTWVPCDPSIVFKYAIRLPPMCSVLIDRGEYSAVDLIMQFCIDGLNLNTCWLGLGFGDYLAQFTRGPG